MRSIKMAMFWEYWQQHRWWVLVFLVGLGSGMIILWWRLQNLNATASFFIHYFTMQLEMVVFLGMVFFRQFDVRKNRLSFCSRLYTLPIRTSVLVAWQMVFPALMVACLYLVTVGAARVAFSVTWPIAGPLLLLLAFLASMQAIVWITTGFPLLQIGLGILSYVQFGRFVSLRYGADNMFHLPRTPWEQLSGGDFLVLVLCAGVAYGIAVIGILRDRRGDCYGWVGLRAFFAGLRDMLPRRSRSFRSVTRAQFWMEWHQKGWAAAEIVAALCLISVLVGGVGLRNAEATFWLFLLVALISLCAPLYVGLMIGALGRRCEMTSFRATRPTSSFTQSMVVTYTALWSMLMAWAVILLAWLITIGWFYLIDQGDAVAAQLQVSMDIVKKIGYSKILGLVALFPLYFWTAVGIGALFTLMGRTWLLWALYGGGLGFFVTLALLEGFGLIPEWLSIAFDKSLPCAIGIICLAGTICIFAHACLRGLIHLWICPFAACVWAALFAGLWLAWRYAFVAGLKTLWFSRAPEASSIIMMGGLLTLTALPLAAGPLALAWNRHR